MIRIGPSGTGPDIEKGMWDMKRAGLDAVELPFTYGVRMTNERAKEIGQLNLGLGLALSIHAPYYINLASEDPLKIEASKKRILDSCERGHHLGATHIVFHPAFYGKRTPEKTASLVSDAIAEMQLAIKRKKWDVLLAPETTGKKAQYGSVAELLAIVDEHGSSMTVDFAHLLARNGRINYGKVLDEVSSLKHVHAHFSGIEFGDRGEKKHLVTPKAEASKLLKEIRKRDVDITIINESPQMMKDCLMMKHIVHSL
ncbi:MAG: TIM barrel protein [Nanoarchaeota archaeon]